MLIIFTIAGCSTTSNVVKVEIEGIEMDVRALKATDSYVASRSKILGNTVLDPKNWRLNKLAIEKATGCKVKCTDLMNSGRSTYATVSCNEDYKNEMEE